jgi:hypothetical protein
MDNLEELFGMNEPETQGSEATEAETAGAEPQEGSEAEAQEETETPEETQPEQSEAPKKNVQTMEERARQAAGRRLREREAWARKDEREKLGAVIRSLEIKNPKTEKNFSSADEVEAYALELSKERVANGQGNDEDIRRVIREEIAKNRIPAEPPEEEQDDGQMPGRDRDIRAEVDKQLENIRRMDPEMTDLNAIICSEAGERFKAYVRKGLNFEDAYTLAAKDRLANLQAGKAQEAARVQAASKDHLNATGKRGTGAAPIPPEVMRDFREIVPDATDEEIQRYYTKYLKNR